MISPFTRYFARNLFFKEKREKILFIAILSLSISSFALLVVDSTMKGLQGNLKSRSMEVEGNILISLPSSYEKKEELVSFIKDEITGSFQLELESELLIKKGNLVLPVTLHGVISKGYRPSYLKDYDEIGVVLPYDLAARLNAFKDERVELITLSSADELLGEIPRSISAKVSLLAETNVPEIDESHLWAPFPMTSNLLKKREINRIRIFSDETDGAIKERLLSFDSSLIVLNWKDRHPALSYALLLESNMMLFLFWMMVVFVAMTISIGLTIFFDKMKRELTAFWILGGSKKSIMRSHLELIILINLAATLVGTILGTLFLFLLKMMDKGIMPEIFIDRTIPVSFSLSTYAMSILIPFLIGTVVSLTSLQLWRRAEEKFIASIRTRMH